MEADAAAYVACPDTIPELAAGATFSGRNGHILVELIEASHLPARKYRNEWLLALSDAQDEPLDDVEVTRLEAFMPVHGHNSRPPAEHQLLEIIRAMIGASRSSEIAATTRWVAPRTCSGRPHRPTHIRTATEACCSPPRP